MIDAAKVSLPDIGSMRRSGADILLLEGEIALACIIGTDAVLPTL